MNKYNYFNSSEMIIALKLIELTSSKQKKINKKKAKISFN